MREYIEKIKQGQSLTQAEIECIMQEVMSGKAQKPDVTDFLMSLREKGPTVEEITGAARIMRKFVVGIKSNHSTVLDTCGTGGDKQHTFNISTTAAFVVAGAGVAVAKHGNRSVSSKCGSADILEGLGVNLNLGPQELESCLNEVGIVFLFAQRHHPAMKKVAAIRKELGVETIFNLLGPLTNPANATHQLVGVYSREYVEPLACVLKNLGLQRAMVVHGSDGLDEITTTSETFISEFNGQQILSYCVSPGELNIPLAKKEDLKGGDLKDNLQYVEDVLQGKKGARRDIVVMNAAFALYLTGKAKSIIDGVEKANGSIDSGKAAQKLEELIVFSNKKSS